MKKLFATLLVAVACVFSGMAHASYTVVRGDTLTAIGKKTQYGVQTLCRVNPQISVRAKGCNDLRVGDVVRFPGFGKKVQPTNVNGEIPYAVVGRAPLRQCGKKDVVTVNNESWTVFSLSQEDKAWLLLNVDHRGPRMDITPEEGLVRILPGVRLEQVTFCRDGKVVATGPMRTAWSAGEAVYGELFVLPSGRALVWMWNCLNWITWTPPAKVVTLIPMKPEPEPTVKPPKEEPPLPPVVSNPPPPAEKIACDEWDAHASAGVELSKGADTHSLAGYLEGEVGACPFKWEGKDGVYNEALIAGRYHETNDKWREWDGKNSTALLGLGLRRTDKDGSVDLYRLMAGSRSNNGSQGLYAQDVRWNVVGLYGTHYRVEDDGTNETHYRWGILVPLGDAKGSASWAGSPLSLPSYNGSLEAGIRRYFTKQGEDWRVFGEVNVNVTAPDYAGIGPRIGVCNEQDTLCVLGGVNIDVQNGGTAAMVGVQINTPGVIRMNRDGVIMKQTVEAATVNGIRFQFAPAQRASPQSD